MRTARGFEDSGQEQRGQRDLRDLRATDRGDLRVADRDGPRLGTPARCRITGIRRSRALAALAALVALATTACVGPPASGPSHTEQLSQSHNNVFILAREPDATMGPELLVRNFLQALTGDQKDPTFSVAQDYLSDDARKGWIPPGADWNESTAIVQTITNPTVDPPAAASEADRGTRATQTQEDFANAPVGTQVPVHETVQQVGELDKHGFYSARSQSLDLPYNLIKTQEGWRILKLPKQRIIGIESFKRVYQTNQAALPIYFPGTDGMPVDQVYLTQATGKVEYTYNALAQAVLNGRSAARTSPIQLDPAHPIAISTQGEATVTVKVPPGATPELDDVETALRNTFTAAAASPQMAGTSPQVNSLAVTYAGCGSGCGARDLNTAERTVPLVYWVCPAVTSGQNAGTTVVAKVPTANVSTASVCGDANHPPSKDATVMSLQNLTVLPNSPLAVRQPEGPSVDKGSSPPQSLAVAAVVTDKNGTSGSVVVTDKRTPESHKSWYVTADAAKITDLEWDPVDGSLWMVEGHSLYHLRDPLDKDAAPAVNLDPIGLPSEAQLTGFKPSPDGTRAVLVTDPNLPDSVPSPWPAAIVAINRPKHPEGAPPTLDSANITPLLTGQNLSLSPSTTLAKATDAAWADARTVVLIGVPQGSNTLRVFKAYSDGTQDSLISSLEDAQPAARHISAAISVLNGRSDIWLFSDNAGPPGSQNSSNVYFKGRNGAESYQESGSSPAVATTLLDPDS